MNPYLKLHCNRELHIEDARRARANQSEVARLSANQFSLHCEIGRLTAELAAAKQLSRANYTRWMRSEEEAEARETVLRAELDAANARADRYEYEFDRLSERMRVRMVECGVKLDKSAKERDTLRVELATAHELLREARNRLPVITGDVLLARIDAALKGETNG